MQVVDAMPEASTKASPHGEAVGAVEVVTAGPLRTGRPSGVGASSSGVGSGNADARRGRAI
eukprot:1942329-Pleurochrysis_carterae.AAC.1